MKRNFTFPVFMCLVLGALCCGIALAAVPDTWSAYHPPPDPAYANAAAVVTNANFAAISRGVYVGVTGDVSATMQAGGTVVFKAVPAGTVLRIRATQITTTNTTATNMVALW